MVSANTYVIARGITPQLKGATPPAPWNPALAPSPQTITSSCGVLPGSTSVTWMSNGAKICRARAIISFHVASP